eukprot:UN08785
MISSGVDGSHRNINIDLKRSQKNCKLSYPHPFQFLQHHEA